MLEDLKRSPFSYAISVSESGSWIVHGRDASCLIARACAERHADPGTRMCLGPGWEEEDSLVHAETAQLSYAVSAIQRDQLCCSATGLRINKKGFFYKFLFHK